jgi:hypothetical protein
MPSLVCPRCQAEFRTGLIYESLDSCPRCGQPFNQSRRSLRRKDRGPDEGAAPDWEAITVSQYARRRVTPPTPDSPDDTPAPV